MTEPIDAIRHFVVETFLPDMHPDELDADYDLLEGEVIDSLGLLQVIGFVEDRFGVVLEDEQLDPRNFRSVRVIAGCLEQARA